MLRHYKKATKKCFSHFVVARVVVVSTASGADVSVEQFSKLATTSPVQLAVALKHDPLSHHRQSLLEATHDGHELNAVHCEMVDGVCVVVGDIDVGTAVVAVVLGGTAEVGVGGHETMQ